MKKKYFSVPFIIGAAGIIMAVAVGVFLGYTLALRTAYKETAYEINESFRTEAAVTMRRGDEEFVLPVSSVQYYDQFLLQPKTAVYSRKAVPSTDETITLDFGKKKLSFTGLEDGSAIAVCWKTPEKEKHYIVRSNMTFMQLSAYYKNCRNKALKANGANQGTVS